MITGQSEYTDQPDYAKSPANYSRAFELLQKDMQLLFDYIESASASLLPHSSNQLRRIAYPRLLTSSNYL
jgi:hypothetical protein